MSLNDPQRDPNRPSISPAAPVRKPRYVLGTFWMVVAIILFIAGFMGNWWGFLLGLGSVAYAIYLYRGGRYGFWFI